ARRINFNTEQMRTTDDDFLHLFSVVVVEARRHSKAGAKRRADHSGACGRPDQSELRQIETQTARLRSLVDNDVEPVIFHRRIEIFFDGRLEPVNFIDEEDIALLQAGEKTGEFPRLFDDRSTGIFDVYTHRV